MNTPSLSGSTPARVSPPRRHPRIDGPGLGRALAAALAAQALLVLLCASPARGATPPTTPAPASVPAVPSHQPFQIVFPLILSHPGDGKIEVSRLSVKWAPAAAGAPEAVRIAVQGAPADGSSVIGSQAWIAAFSAAFVWQAPWQGAGWEIGAAPASDGTGVTAPLAVAMIAAAAGTPYPADATVLADLNPDGSLAPLPRMEERLQAASAAGLKRVVLPSVARAGTADLAQQAADLGLACTFADTLSEATAQLLGERFAPVTPVETVAPLDPAVRDLLAADAQTLLDELQKERTAWPIGPERQASVPLWQRALWGEAAAHLDTGAELLRGGKSYAALGELGEAQALAYALVSLAPGIPEASTLSAEAGVLSTEYRGALARLSNHQEELQNALVVAEAADWADAVIADLDGARNLVYQTSGPRSDALPEQREMARLQLAMAVKKAEAKRGRMASFAALHRLLVARNTVEVYDRAALWRPQLIPAHLALGQAFVLRLQEADPQLAQNLIYDARLTEQTRLLRDRKEEWDRRHGTGASAASAPADDAGGIGFVPGAAYRSPRAEALPALRPAAISDTEATLRWVDDYTEMALLSARYFQFGGSYHPHEMAWTIEDRAVLAGMLRNAELAARRGISAARETGLDPAVLQLIYQRAQALSQSRLDSARMEGLRQYWRCNLLGATAWQLAAIPKAEGILIAATPTVVPPKTAAKPPAAPVVAVAKAEPVLPATPVPTPAAAPIPVAVAAPAAAPAEETRRAEPVAPTAVVAPPADPAHALNDEEMDSDEVRRADFVTFSAD